GNASGEVPVRPLELLLDVPERQVRVLQVRLRLGELAQGGGEVRLGGLQPVVQDLVAAGQGLVLRGEGPNRGLVVRVVDVKDSDSQGRDQQGRRQRRRPPAALARLKDWDPG